MSPVSYPNESREYRVARERLLEAEIELRDQVRRVAQLRQSMPLGGLVARDYEFDESVEGAIRKVRLSQLFENGKESLFLYSFMYGSAMTDACPMCSSFLDGLNASAAQLSQRINLAVVATSPIERIADFGARKGWNHLRLLSAAGNDYPRDYFGQTDGGEMPMANVFVNREDEIRHFWGSEMLYAGLEGEPRHIDTMWPLWNVLDAVPEGRGETWYPSLWPPEAHK